MNTTLVTRALAREILATHRAKGNGRIFNVTFKRKNDSRCGKRKAGDVESMNVRHGVTKHLKQADGTMRKPKHGQNYFADRNLIGVYAVSRKATIPGTKSQGGIGFRSIGLETIASMTVDGVHYDIID
jgi:hypothetical protein